MSPVLMHYCLTLDLSGRTDTPGIIKQFLEQANLSEVKKTVEMADGQCVIRFIVEGPETLPELNQMPEVPWNRMAAEMRANIRLGLAAGECVRSSERPMRDAPLFTGARATVALASVLALMVTGLMLERPAPPMPRSNEPMVLATANGIQRRSGDQAFGLMHSGVGASSVTYTVSAQGTMGARYTDPETGYVTMTKVYVE